MPWPSSPLAMHIAIRHCCQLLCDQSLAGKARARAQRSWRRWHWRTWRLQTPTGAPFASAAVSRPSPGSLRYAPVHRCGASSQPRSRRSSGARCKASSAYCWVYLTTSGFTWHLALGSKAEMHHMVVDEAAEQGGEHAGGTCTAAMFSAIYWELRRAQVLAGAEEALRRLHVSDPERNAILDTFGYVEARLGPAALAGWACSPAAAGSQPALAPALGAAPSARGGGGGAAHKPFTRSGPGLAGVGGGYNGLSAPVYVALCSCPMSGALSILTERTCSAVLVAMQCSCIALDECATVQMSWSQVQCGRYVRAAGGPGIHQHSAVRRGHRRRPAGAVVGGAHAGAGPVPPAGSPCMHQAFLHHAAPATAVRRHVCERACLCLLRTLW